MAREPLLAIETTGRLCSVALRAADGRAVFRSGSEGLRHLTSLVPMIEEVLCEAGLKAQELGSIAVSAGPGSFTGARIGVATARALAQVWSVPLVKVPTLESFVFADGFAGLPRLASKPRNDGGKRTTFAMTEGMICCPVFDARREQIYAGAFVLEGGVSGAGAKIMTLVPAGAYAPAEFCAAAEAGIGAYARYREQSFSPAELPPLVLRFFGEGAELFKTDLERFDVPAKKEFLPEIAQDARATLLWAENFGVPVSYDEVEPIYLRKAEAQRKLDEKAGAGEKFTFREAIEADARGMNVIERLSFNKPWVEQSIIDDLRLEYSDYIVCEQDGMVLGYAGLHLIDGEGEITNIGVHPAVRRRGIGSAALCEIMRRARKRGADRFSLEVRESNAAARSLYEKAGFVREGERKNYYPQEGADGREDALILRKRDKAL